MSSKGKHTCIRVYWSQTATNRNKSQQNATKRNKTQQYSTRQLQFLQTLTLTRQLQFLQLIIPTYANIRILFKKGAKTNPKLQETCVSMSVCLSRKTIFYVLFNTPPTLGVVVVGAGCGERSRRKYFWTRKGWWGRGRKRKRWQS